MSWFNVSAVTEQIGRRDGIVKIGEAENNRFIVF